MLGLIVYESKDKAPKTKTQPKQMNAIIKIRHTSELAEFLADLSTQTLGSETEVTVQKVGEFWEVKFSR